MNLGIKFSRVGILLGFLLGLWEGYFALLHQCHAHLYEPGVSAAILFIAPFVDALIYGILGAILGAGAVLSNRKFPGREHFFAAFGLAIASAQFIYLAVHARARLGHLAGMGISLAGGVLVGILAVKCGRVHFGKEQSNLWRTLPFLLRLSILTAGAVAAGLVTMALSARIPGAQSALQGRKAGDHRPNIVMIALDSARADHFSAYGYAKATTPNLDRLASKGVLFETAIAPAPSTMPSFACVFTGVLPHQNGATLDSPLRPGSSTLASILSARGYQTAGFNANFTEGTARTGLGQGFGLYDDDDGTMRSSLISIELLRPFWWFVYYPFIRADYPARRDARILNRDVVKWVANRRNPPLFLFVNYYDVHEPYSEIAEIGDRFGDARTTWSQRIRSEVDGYMLAIDPSRSPQEQAALIAGYDSSLAFADAQIGNLLKVLEVSPEWSNTYVIVFADHGQAFGTHGHYGHAWGLNSELLRVPLMIVGPGIPPGRRVREVVGIQQLFSTVLDLSVGEGGAPIPGSLRRSWILPAGQDDPDGMVISELGTVQQWGVGSPEMSVVTPKWHFIRDAANDMQLYDVIADPGEVTNLAGSPQHQVDVENLQIRLLERVQDSSLPWPGEEYLWALGERQYSVLAGKYPIHNWPSSKPARPSPRDNELLHSLPYQ